jgi:hypothetical protein
VFSNQTTGVPVSIPVSLTVAAAAPMPFAEGFESGTLSNYWAATGTADYRIQVTSARNPDSGTYHVTMDDSTAAGFSRNELTLTVNLANYTNVLLSYRGREFSDDPHPPPPSFVNGADFDGVAISADGVTWYSVADSSSFENSYQSYQVDLDTALAANGLRYNSLFRIRFNQYGKMKIPSNGAAYDNIAITGRFNEDLDGDGIPNAWELQYFGGPTNAVPGLDDDEDGITNIGEYIADTNPTSDVSFLQVAIAPRESGDGIELHYESSTGRVYSIFCISNLETENSVQIQTNEPGLGTASVLLLDTSMPSGVFRLEVALP